MWISDWLLSIWAKVGIISANTPTPKVSEVTSWTKGKVDEADIERTSDEIKQLIMQRNAQISMFVLEKINWNSFVSKKSFVNNMWEVVALEWESLKIISIDTHREVNTLTFEVIDIDGNSKWEEFTFSEWVFFHNTKWCFEEIENLFNQAEQEIPKTW